MKNILLQFSTSDYSNSEPLPPIMFWIILITLWLVSIYITRLIFSIDTFLRYQKAQTMLLFRIAKNNGLTTAETEKLKILLEAKPLGYIDDVKDNTNLFKEL